MKQSGKTYTNDVRNNNIALEGKVIEAIKRIRISKDAKENIKLRIENRDHLNGKKE